MSVLGIDLGNESGVIAQALRGGVDIILNEGSKRLSPVLVSFLGNERFMGEAAVSQLRTNMANTVTQVKRLLGRKFSDEVVQEDIKTHLNYKIVQLPGDEIGIEVAYCDTATVFTPQQILAAFLTKLKAIVNIANPAVTTPDVVLSVPAYYTDAQRRAVMDAATISGYNCLRVLNEGTAAALSYGIYKSAKKEFAEGKESKVLFLDMGNAHFTATVAAFTNQSLKIVASASDDSIGGREIDAAIAHWFAGEFKAKSGLDAWSNRKARLKLMIAAEKAKVGITPYGVNSTPVSVECLMNDFDFSATLTVDKMEELVAPLMERLKSVVQRAMAQSGTAGIAELLAVELVGGGMRPRIIKRKAGEALGVIVNDETGVPLSTSMNLDECISRGCALACAMLSPVFRVKPFEIVDACQYPLRVCWDAASKVEAAGAAADDAVDDDAGVEGAVTDAAATSTVLFKIGDASPVTRRVTFRRTGPFELVVEEGDAAIPVPRVLPRIIARYSVDMPLPADDIEMGGAAPKVRIDFRHDHNGIVSLVRAEVLREIKEAPPPAAPAAADASAVPMAVEGAAESAAAVAPAPDASAAGAVDVAAPAPKKRFRRAELPFRASGLGSMAPEAVSSAAAAEKAMIARDNEIRATHDMRNSLEASIYSTRSALEEALSKYADASTREYISNQLNDAESWLYGDGFEADKKTLEARRKDLLTMAQPLQSRKWEAENRYDAIQNLVKIIEDFRGVADNASGKHAHLSDSDRDTIRAACRETESFLQAKQAEQSKLELHQDPVLRVAEITTAKERLSRELAPIANKPVPPPPVIAAPPAPVVAAVDVPMADAAQDVPMAAPEGDAAAAVPTPSAEMQD